MADLLTIGELSARSGVASSALRFYEERGLISSERASSGHRRFARPVIRRVAFIVFAQRVGLSLDEIREELVKLPADRAPNRGDWAKLSSAWSTRIDAAHRRARAPEGGPDRMHRLRLPLAGPLPAGQPGRPRSRARPRPALLDRRSPTAGWRLARAEPGVYGCRARSSRRCTRESDRQRLREGLRRACGLEADLELVLARLHLRRQLQLEAEPSGSREGAAPPATTFGRAQAQRSASRGPSS